MGAENVISVEDKNKENVCKLLEEIFESSILEADLSDSVDNMIHLYDSFSTQGFESSFEDILMLTLYESKRSNDVKKIFRFISEFIVSLDNKYKTNLVKSNEDDEDQIHPFLKNLVNMLTSWSKATSYIIRSQACHLLYMILTNILDMGVGEIDVSTYDKIETVIQARQVDVSANVRAHAVLLAKFFQDPSDHNDSVIAGLCWQMQTDPNARVRQNIVDIIAACEETIIPVTRRFLHDKNALVRNAALLHICNRISPRSYTTHHRILILNQCFYDASPVVRRNAEQKLIPMWFRAYGDKLCNFFKNLRLGNECLDKLPFVTDLLYLLFKFTKISQILEEIDLDPDTSLPKSLNGEKIFIWHHFYAMASRQEKLRKFVPKPESLVEFLIKSFKESAFENNEACAFNELISFAMDAIDIMDDENCEKLPSVALDIMKNPFLPREIMSYAVAFYCEYASRETKEIHSDLLQLVGELMKIIDISSGEEQKKLALKCLDILSETLAQDNISSSVEMITLKDELVLSFIDSDDIDLKSTAFRALTLYCLLDLEEARQFWPLIEKTIYESPVSLKHCLLESAFDILKCHGPHLFGDDSIKSICEFEDALDKLLSQFENAAVDMSTILKGMFKLYLSHHTYSPFLLARLILLLFHPVGKYTTKTNITNFFQLYGESKQEAECLTKTFLIIINVLFDLSKTSPYYKVSIKTVANKLLEFSKVYEENKDFEIEKRFKDLLLLKLTKKFLKKPWRFPLLDLQDICNHNMPQDTDMLLKLKANVKLIVESLQSAAFQKTHPFSKKSSKFFASYLKKIQVAIDTNPDEDQNSQRHDSFSGSGFLSTIPIEVVSPVLLENSFG